MKKFLLLFFGAVLAANVSFAGNYTLDNNVVDNLFDAAVETTMTVATDVLSDTFNSVNVASFNASDETMTVLIAWIVDWVGLGAFGVHRYVLGTKGSMWAIYTFTVCGIFGIVPTIDWWVLLIDGLILGNGSKYMDNEKFFMWLN